jgi:hypothetical protein
MKNNSENSSMWKRRKETEEGYIEEEVGDGEGWGEKGEKDK